ncbi:hypothetical protein BZG36_03530 [Bifiguratus adelaidae]|uniref:Acid phosphatase n=1 Tax=Bifiguratus adelaidae TaxID=1938954 RepID=A0A261XZ86_9FUNG|nr:hypothetical protein BZG36_03530 [Bifiguratus adelaidae]
MRGLSFVALSAFLALSSVNAQTPSADFVSGSPLIVSAYPSATAAAYDNTAVPGAPTGKVFQYFMQVWLENENYDTCVGLPQYQAMAEQGILLSNYNAITHPSEPNYVAATAGSNLGIDEDDYYNIPANQTSIFDLVENKAGTLEIDIAANNMPAYSFYTPNITNDGHNTDAPFAGNWLNGFWNSTLKNATFLENALVLVVFDETETYTIRNQVWGVLLGGVIPENLKNTTDDTYYTHYSALRTVELNWGLGSLGLGDADPSSSNVFAFAATALNYTNVNVTDIPMNNDTIVGYLTNKSYNETSSPTTSTAMPTNSSSSTSGAAGAVHMSATAAIGAFSAVVAAAIPYFL